MSDQPGGLRIAIRTDGSHGIGSGHVMRCLTLADALAARGAVVEFVSRLHTGHLCDMMEERGYMVHRLAEPALLFNASASHPPAHWQWLGADASVDVAQTAACLLTDSAWDWLVVDHYAIESAWESAFLQAHQDRFGSKPRLLVIDDLADRPHCCDILLDQNLQPSGRYTPLVPRDCQTLLGPHFALLRPAFSRQRTDTRSAHASRKGVLLYFGGSDAQDMTLQALEAFAAVTPHDMVAIVVVSAACPTLQSIRLLAQDLGDRCQLHVGIADMAFLMRQCRIAVGAAGSTTWERFSLGLASILVSVADNQIAVAMAVAEAGAAMYLGRAGHLGQPLRNALASLLDQPLLESALRNAAMALCDGKGTDRVVRQMLQAAITLRPAGPNDARMLFEWRNSPPVRAASFESGELEWDSHLAWMQQSLANPQRHLLVAQANGQDCGCVRFDTHADHAVISVYLAPQFLQLGLGSAVIATGSRWLFDTVPAAGYVSAEVMPANQASLRAFERAGFLPDRHRLRYTRAVVPSSSTA